MAFLCEQNQKTKINEKKTQRDQRDHKNRQKQKNLFFDQIPVTNRFFAGFWPEQPCKEAI